MPSMPNGPSNDAHLRRLKTADVTSGLGALILGVGLGAIFATRLSRMALVLSGTGAVLHAVGMWEKHRLEALPGGRRPWWVSGLYWLCWLLMAAGAISMLIAD